MNFICAVCCEEFSRPVWHCRYCGHHWADPEDDICKNCHQERPRTNNQQVNP